MKLGQCAARTDPGRKRRGNEDSFVSRPPLFAIADGMGGARAGEVASALAAGALEESSAGRGGEAYVVELIQEANRRVHERASTDAETSGMGTTITVALIENDGTVTMGHVGDSRAYLLRGDRLEQLTDDHSLVAELVRRGELSPAGGGGPSAALGDHPRARHRPRRRRRRILRRRAGRRRLPDLLRRAVGHGRRRADRGDHEHASRRSRRHGEGARPGREPRRRRGQHHRGPLRDGRGRAVRPASPTSGRASSSLPLDDEDTLHPEDGVVPPPPADDDSPAPADTMVVAAADLQAAIAAQSPEPPQAGIGRRLLALAVIAALDRRDRRARLVGARALSLSYRNRELVYLAVVGVLTGIGFASVYIARQSLVSWGSLGYAVFFFALYIAAHIVTRITVPNADPYLLPMAGLLTAVGVTEIYRLGVERRVQAGPLDRRRRRAVRRRALRPAARLPRPRAVQVPLRHRRDRAALPAARARASARPSTAHGSGCTSAASRSSRASSRRSS